MRNVYTKTTRTSGIQYGIQYTFVPHHLNHFKISAPLVSDLQRSSTRVCLLAQEPQGMDTDFIGAKVDWTGQYRNVYRTDRDVPFRRSTWGWTAKHATYSCRFYFTVYSTCRQNKVECHPSSNHVGVVYRYIRMSSRSICHHPETTTTQKKVLTLTGVSCGM